MDIGNALPGEANERSLNRALRHGWARKCPRCGGGPLFRGYLTVRRECLVCGQDFTPQRADDGPAWATMLLTGHLMAPLMLWWWEVYHPPAWVMATGLSLVFVTLSLYLLPRLKGAFIGFQWAKRMHGFGDED